VIRVNSQSGKGGVAWVLEQDKGLKLPKKMQASFSHVVQALADETSRELGAEDIRGGASGYSSGGSRSTESSSRISGRGNGLISGVIDALAGTTGPSPRRGRL
jgi:2-isopropylmalate synthase